MAALSNVAIADSRLDVDVDAMNAAAAKEVIADALVAKGGRQKLSAFSRYRMISTGTVTVSGKEITLDSEHVVVGDQSRTDMKQSNMPIPGTWVIDGKKGWRINPPCPCARTQSGPKLEDIPDEDIRWDELERWRNPDLVLLRADEPDVQVAAAFDVRIDGKPHAVVRLRAPNGVDVRLYFDRQTKLLSRMKYDEQRVFAGKPVGATIVDYSDYRDIGGIKIAFKQRGSNREASSTLEISSIDFAPVVDPEVFKKPVALPSSLLANSADNVPPCGASRGDKR